jgi:hypothetical protein
MYWCCLFSQKQVMILENMLRHFTTTQLQNGAPTPQQYSFLATTLLLKVWEFYQRTQILKFVAICDCSW